MNSTWFKRYAMSSIAALLFVSSDGICQITGQITVAEVNDPVTGSPMVLPGDYFQCTGEATVTVPSGDLDRHFRLNCRIMRRPTGGGEWVQVAYTSMPKIVVGGSTGELTTSLGYQSDIVIR